MPRHTDSPDLQGSGRPDTNPINICLAVLPDIQVPPEEAAVTHPSICRLPVPLLPPASVTTAAGGIIDDGVTHSDDRSQMTNI